MEVLTSLLDVEGLGSSVALQPETRPLFPREQHEIERQGQRIGESLASAEHAGLWYDLATFLASKDQAERRRIVEELLKLGGHDE